ncbi:MAG: DUF2357 domain-containing protein [Capsulimonadales bacterium]|nr:DUF2357 domain-containing protein [Capsulimonadales bacterium]
MRVTPLPILTEPDRRRMLAEIGCVALAIGRDLFPDVSVTDPDLERIAAGEGPEGPSTPCPRERVAYLSSVRTRLENALRRIEREPETRLRPEERITPLERARRATPKERMTALTRSVGKGPPRVREWASAPTVNTPANVLIKSILVLLLRDGNAAAALAAVVGARSVEREALLLRDLLKRTLRREPWRDLPIVTGAVLPALPLSVRRNGPYRLVYDLFRRYRQGFAFDWTTPLFALPPREMWLLYEYWCLFRTADAVRRLGFRAREASDFMMSRSGLTFTLVRGRASALTFVRDGQRLTLTYGREFPPASAKRRDAWRSRSHAMRPDIVLEMGGRLLVLDAKYKAYAETFSTEDPDNLPLTADINQCHAYRDGILHGDRPAVVAAWLLYPGHAERNNRAVISYGDGERSEVGAIRLRDVRDTAHLVSLMAVFLSTVEKP